LPTPDFLVSTGITPACFQNPLIFLSAGWCDFLQIASNIIGLLYSIHPDIGLHETVGGLFCLPRAGTKAHGARQGFIKSALIGVAIALGAGILIGFLIKGLGVTQDASLMPWLF
jgi:hypothetical protein